MPNSDAFALKNLGVDAFLFSEVGTELNGSALTILSVLARLGQDPWAEAGRWAKLPRAATIDRLVRSISQMPLCPQALLDAPATASRLILLLPEQARTTGQSGIATVSKPSAPRQLSASFFYFVLIFGMALNMLMTPKYSVAPAAPAAQIEQTAKHAP